MPRRVEPRLLKGFRDYLPEMMIPRTRLLRRIAGVFERFGFEPLDTPTLEYSDILLAKAGPEQEKLIYRFKDHGDRDVAMRYELTISLARVLAQYSTDLPRPFKRYQMGPVWRADAPGKGRFREFWQCDVDIVGTQSLLADAECLAIDHAVMTAVGVNTHVIRFNNRKLFRALGELLVRAVYESGDGFGDGGVSETRIVRAVDKIDKIGRRGVEEELKLVAPNAAMLAKLGQYLDLAQSQADNDKRIQELKEFFAGSRVGLQACDELSQVLATARQFDIPEQHLSVDPTIARGLDYYTGTVFETTLTNAPDYGSVMSGGRYDGLVGVFANQDEPAVGISVGVDRLIAALDELKLLEKSKACASVLVTIFDDKPESVKQSMVIAQSLRGTGINAELYLDPGAKLKKQLAYAQRKEIPWVVIAGPDETARGEVTLREMATGQQMAVALGLLSQTLCGQSAQ